VVARVLSMALGRIQARHPAQMGSMVESLGTAA
jgi:hypothetical protein